MQAGWAAPGRPVAWCSLDPFIALRDQWLCAAVTIRSSVRCVAMGGQWAPGAGDGRPLQALLDDIDCTALDVIEYLTDLAGPSERVDASGAACVRRYVELLDELAGRRSHGLASDYGEPM
jgi:hypothetical protein